MINEFIRASEPAPHTARRKEIESKYPEVKSLFGRDTSTAVFVVLLALSQLALAILLRDSSFWLILLTAYVVGALISHALFVLIHDCSHNLVFKGTAANKLLAIFANIPQGIPAAISFRKFHLLHHKSMGKVDEDADLPTPSEARLVGNSAFGKALWLSLYSFVVGGVRPAHLRNIQFYDRWVLVNQVVVFACMVGLVVTFGWNVLAYILLSTFFSVGLHPVGARWIQEHFVVVPGQETYSYYGPMNKLAFNVGYHNEHHDFILIPWSKLPALRRMAPEFYDTLYFHTSWTKLLFVFLSRRDLSLFSRVIRD